MSESWLSEGQGLHTSLVVLSGCECKPLPRGFCAPSVGVP